MVLAGVLVGLLYENSIAAVLNTEAVQHIAEIIVAVLLFVDAPVSAGPAHRSGRVDLRRHTRSAAARAAAKLFRAVDRTQLCGLSMRWS